MWLIILKRDLNRKVDLPFCFIYFTSYDTQVKISICSFNSLFSSKVILKLSNMVFLRKKEKVCSLVLTQ